MTVEVMSGFCPGQVGHQGEVIVQRLDLHRLLEALDRGLDQLVDILGRKVEEVLHQAELG